MIKVKYHLNEQSRIIGYTINPKKENSYTFEYENKKDIPYDITNGYHTIVNGRIVKLDYLTIEQVQKNNESKEFSLRIEREPLLLAFDKWEKAVIRGRELDDSLIMEWFEDIKKLKESAFEENNIPERVKYYMGVKQNECNKSTRN